MTAPLLVFLDRQHVGKPSARWVSDMGARHDLDGDGAASLWEAESTLTASYGLAAEIRLRDLGHRVLPISDGEYYARHARVNGYVRSFPGYRFVYVAMHCNAGGGRYGLVLHDYRSVAGGSLARTVGEMLRGMAPELNEVKAIAARPNDWTTRAYGTFARVNAPISLCYEPFFVDQADHADLADANGLCRIGAALAEGINAWAKGIDNGEI